MVVRLGSRLQHSLQTECEQCMLGLKPGPCQLRLGDLVSSSAGFSDALSVKKYKTCSLCFWSFNQG